jgi:hypothetical protein
MRALTESDALHRLWVHQPDFSDFHLELDINAAKGFKRSEIAVRQEPVFDLTRVSDLVMHGLGLDSNGFTHFNKEAYPEEYNPNLYAVHFDLPGRYLKLLKVHFWHF